MFTRNVDGRQRAYYCGPTGYLDGLVSWWVVLKSANGPDGGYQEGLGNLGAGCFVVFLGALRGLGGYPRSLGLCLIGPALRALDTDPQHLDHKFTP